MTTTPEALRAEARDARLEAQASWERSDTDGFLSQWASGLTARLKDAEADVAEAGGVSEFPALFDLDGNLVPAKLVTTKFGMAWGLLDTANPRGKFIGWFNPSRAQAAATRNLNNARKGFTVGTVLAPAKAVMESRGTGLSGSAWVAVVRTDGGWSEDAVVVSTKQEPDAWENLQAAKESV